MKIVFAGGGTGGHFYPIIAITQALQDIVDRDKLLEPELYFLSNDPYDKRALYEYSIEYRYVPAGKWRRYFSLKNITDAFKTAAGVLKALSTLYNIYPDIVFSKGGYASFPVVVAAKILRIPVVIHESDSKPGRANKYAGQFAKRIAVSWPQAAKYFKRSDVVAHTGNPIRRELIRPLHEGAHEYLKLEPNIPVILVLGGSQGAERINDVLLDAVPKLVERYQIIHQTGKAHIEAVKELANVVLEDNPFASRYKPFPFLDLLALRMAAGVADIVVTRAGSQIFEIAAWGVPSIVIPIPEEISHDQRSNAFEYARHGGGIVIEQANLTDDILISQIDTIVGDEEKKNVMGHKALEFAPTNAAEIIAQEIIDLGLEHEK